MAVAVARLMLAVVVGAVCWVGAEGAAFKTTSVLVQRTRTRSNPATTATAVYIDEIDGSTGKAVQTITLPSSTSGGRTACTVTQNSPNGRLAVAADGASVALACMSVSSRSTLSSTAGINNPRIVARFLPSAAYDLTTKCTTCFKSQPAIAAPSLTGGGFWYVGGSVTPANTTVPASEIRYMTYGTSVTTPPLIVATGGTGGMAFNWQDVQLSPGGALYGVNALRNAPASAGVYRIASAPVPTASTVIPATITLVLALGVNATSLVFASDTQLWVSENLGGPAGITGATGSGGSWSRTGSFNLPGVTTALSQLTGRAEGSSYMLYAVTTGALYRIDVTTPDTPVIKRLLTVTSGYVYGGVAPTPVTPALRPVAPAAGARTVLADNIGTAAWSSRAATADAHRLATNATAGLAVVLTAPAWMATVTPLAVSLGVMADVAGLAKLAFGLRPYNATTSRFGAELWNTTVSLTPNMTAPTPLTVDWACGSSAPPAPLPGAGASYAITVDLVSGGPVRLAAVDAAAMPAPLLALRGVAARSFSTPAWTTPSYPLTALAAITLSATPAAPFAGLALSLTGTIHVAPVLCGANYLDNAPGAAAVGAADVLLDNTARGTGAIPAAPRNLTLGTPTQAPYSFLAAVTRITPLADLSLVGVTLLLLAPATGASPGKPRITITVTVSSSNGTLAALLAAAPAAGCSAVATPTLPVGSSPTYLTLPFPAPCLLPAGAYAAVFINGTGGANGAALASLAPTPTAAVQPWFDTSVLANRSVATHESALWVRGSAAAGTWVAAPGPAPALRVDVAVAARRLAAAPSWNTTDDFTALASNARVVYSGADDGVTPASGRSVAVRFRPLAPPGSGVAPRRVHFRVGV